jgi:hypothetical protein
MLDGNGSATAVEVRAGCSAPWPAVSDAAPDFPLLPALAAAVGAGGGEAAPAGAAAGAGGAAGVAAAAAGACARLVAFRKFDLRMMLRLQLTKVVRISTKECTMESFI